jgi:hypothetical protein
MVSVRENRSGVDGNTNCKRKREKKLKKEEVIEKKKVAGKRPVNHRGNEIAERETVSDCRLVPSYALLNLERGIQDAYKYFSSISM